MFNIDLKALRQVSKLINLKYNSRLTIIFSEHFVDAITPFYSSIVAIEKSTVSQINDRPVRKKSFLSGSFQDPFSNLKFHYSIDVVLSFWKIWTSGIWIPMFLFILEFS